MMKELQEFKVEYKDFKMLLEQRVKNRQNVKMDKDLKKGKKEAKENAKESVDHAARKSKVSHDKYTFDKKATIENVV